MIEDGQPAPDIELAGDDGKTIRLSKVGGTAAVMYFYPKDDTSGCTAEAKDFSRLAAEYEKAGAEVIGVSPDSVASHRKFKTKHALAVKLATDDDKSAAQAFGVWVEKSMYGRKYMGVERATFLFDRSGRLARSWRKVKVAGHAEDVLAAVRALAP